MIEKIFAKLEENGYKGRIVSIRHLQDLQFDLVNRHRQKLFDEEFYQERLTWFKFSPPETLPEAKSIFIVADPQPQYWFTFNWNGKSIPGIVPPTYLYWQNTDKKVENLLREILVPKGYEVAPSALPVKLLAVHSGLAQYGRNNISYVSGMGSFHRLVAIYSDFPCSEDSWRDLKMMDKCEKCSACLRNCPAGAITAERFLIKAERCITFHNERAGNIPFPKWLDQSWHNCLVGCMHCQNVCPENTKFLKSFELAAEFSQAETELIIQETPLERIPANTIKKLEQYDLIEGYDILPRNLKILLKQEIKNNLK
jgi:epoxyqueuosine reductase